MLQLRQRSPKFFHNINELSLKIDRENLRPAAAAVFFLPLFLFYILVVLKTSTNTFFGDEASYVEYARRFLTGQYFSNPQDVKLWWGPGYPLFLAPFVALHVPLIAAKILNAALLYGALLYLYYALSAYIRPTYAFLIALFAGIYPPFLRYIGNLYTESLAIFLICGFIFHSSRLIRGKTFSRSDFLLASFFVAYLALTKVIFGYIIIASAGLYGLLYILRKGEKSRRALLVYLTALALCVPYLIGTYALTGRAFYWGSSGGMSLYWMSTPYSDEYGDWFSENAVAKTPELSAHHGDFFTQVSTLSEPEMDAAFKQKAIKNILQHPMKYFTNWIANLGRMTISYPFSYESQKISTFFYIIPNSLLIVLVLLSLVPSLNRWAFIPYELKTFLGFSLIGLGGSSLLSAYDRMFMPFVPFLIVWMAFVFTRVVVIRLVEKEAAAS